MRRARVSAAIVVVAATLLLNAPGASANVVCDVGQPLPILGGLLTSGVQTGLIDIGPTCPTSDTTSDNPPSTGSQSGSGSTSSGGSTPAPTPTLPPAPGPTTPAAPRAQLIDTRSNAKQPTVSSPQKKKTSPGTTTIATTVVGVVQFISTPVRAGTAVFGVIALLIAMWMGLRIGRRRAARVAELAAEAQLSAVMAIVPDGIIVADKTGAVKAVNEAAAQLLGADEGARGTPVTRLLRGAERTGITLESWMRSTADHPAGTTGTLDNGLPVGIAASPVRAGHSLAGSVFLIRDLRKERALERMKEEFLSNVSHELRTPLASALGFARLLRRRELSATQQGAFVDAIVEACERLDRVVDLLIDIAALESGNVRTDAELIKPGELVHESAGRWRERSTDHIVHDRIETGLPEIPASSALIRNAIDELIDNAVKFSPGGGIVTIGAGSTNHGKRAIVITVSDQGIGIEPAKQETLFDDFHQIDGSATRHYGGLGIGLGFVRRVARAHGGRVDVSSEPGRGSTFTITLPVRRVPAQRQRRQPAPRKLTVGPRRPSRVVSLEKS
jgi:signal transduction histidine kinase